MSSELLARARAVVEHQREIAETAVRPGSDAGVWTYVVTKGGDFKVVDDLGYSILGHYDIDADVWNAGPHVALHDPQSILARCARWTHLLDEYEAAMRRVDVFNGGMISTAVVHALEPWVKAIADECEVSE